MEEIDVFMAEVLDMVKMIDPNATKEILKAKDEYDEEQRLNDKLLKKELESINRTYEERMSSIAQGRF